MASAVPGLELQSREGRAAGAAPGARSSCSNGSHEWRGGWWSTWAGRSSAGLPGGFNHLPATMPLCSGRAAVCLASLDGARVGRSGEKVVASRARGSRSTTWRPSLARRGRSAWCPARVAGRPSRWGSRSSIQRRAGRSWPGRSVSWTPPTRCASHHRTPQLSCKIGWREGRGRRAPG